MNIAYKFGYRYYECPVLTAQGKEIWLLLPGALSIWWLLEIRSVSI